MNALVASDALDLSKYQPGDVLVLTAHQIMMLSGPSWLTNLESRLAEVARRSGTDVAIEEDVVNAEWRVTFK